MPERAMPKKPLSDLRIFYIPTGIGFPYNPGIETFVLRGLRTITRFVSLPEGPVPLWEQVACCNPDIVLTLVGHNLDSGTVHRIRNMGYRVALWATEDPYYSDIAVSRAQAYDYVFTIESNSVQLYREAGCRMVRHLPLGFDPATHHPGDAPPQYQSDICFVGVAFRNRLALIHEISDYLLQKRVAIVGPWWENLPRYQAMRHMIRNEVVSPEETRLYYAGARITLNIHRRHDDDTININQRRVEGHSPNSRTFEINACGTLQITDFRRDLPNWYAIGQEIVIFRDAADLCQKIDYFLKNEDQRRQIALNGLKRSQQHTYKDRLAAMFEAILDP